MLRRWRVSLGEGTRMCCDMEINSNNDSVAESTNFQVTNTQNFTNVSK